MKLTLETNIGTVVYELNGHFVHVYTEQESAREFSLNLWDHATKKLRIETSIDDVFLEVANSLNELFPNFSVDSLVVDYAPVEKLLQSTLIRSYVAIMKFNEEQEKTRQK